MMADSANYNVEMDGLQTYHGEINFNLTNLQAFSGLVVVDMVGPVSTTTQQLYSNYIVIETHVNTQYAAALASYTDIQTMTEAIQIYNGNVSVFTTRVDIGMTTINAARDLRYSLVVVI